MPNEFAEHPIEVFARNVWINPFWEDSLLSGLIETVGVDRVCFGSDFPHAEGLDDPRAWAENLSDLPEDDGDPHHGRELVRARAAARHAEPRGVNDERSTRR